MLKNLLQSFFDGVFGGARNFHFAFVRLGDAPHFIQHRAVQPCHFVALVDRREMVFAIFYRPFLDPLLRIKILLPQASNDRVVQDVGNSFILLPENRSALQNIFNALQL